MNNKKDQYDHDTTGIISVPKSKDPIKISDSKIAQLEQLVAGQGHELSKLKRDINRYKVDIDQLTNKVNELSKRLNKHG